MKKRSTVKRGKGILTRGAALVLCIMLCASVSATVSYADNTALSPASNITAAVNGQVMTFETTPMIAGKDTVMVPVQKMLDRMGYTVTFNINTLNDGSEEYRIIAYSADDNKVVVFYADEAYMYLASYTEWQADRQAPLSNPRAIQVAPVYYGGHVLVPLSAITEATGANIRWNANTGRITVITDAKDYAMRYDGTEIITCQYVTGVNYTDVERNESGAYVYEYPSTDPNALDITALTYYYELLDMGYWEAIHESAKILLFSPVNEPIYMTVDGGKLVVSPLKYEFYWQWYGDSESKVPDYGYETGSKCSKMSVDSSGDIAYTYTYTRDSMDKYIKKLESCGFSLTSSSDATKFYENGVSRVYIEQDTMLGRVTITPSIATASTQNASGRIRIKVNGKEVECDTDPVVRNGRTLVPLRAVFEEMGANVTWNSPTLTARCVLGGDSVEITIGSSMFKFNRTQRSLDAPAELVGWRVMVPLRALAEALGGNVSWDDSTRTIEVII